MLITLNLGSRKKCVTKYLLALDDGVNNVNSLFGNKVTVVVDCFIIGGASDITCR